MTSRSLTPKGDYPEDKLPSPGLSSLQTKPWVHVVSSPSYTQWMVHGKVREFCSRCTQENRGKSTFFFYPHNPSSPTHSNTWTDSLCLSCLLTLRFIFRADSSSIFSKTHTHTHRVHMCAPVYTVMPGLHSWIHTHIHSL